MTGPISAKDFFAPRQTPATPPAPPPQPETRNPKPETSATLAKDRAAFQRASVPATTWTKDRPLSEAKNAHSTNTKEDFEHALEGGYNFFEGDIRTEINPPYALEMRHDPGHESGDNLTLEEWLTKGKESGRGLKLDVKEGDRLGDILAMCEKVGVPSERLMFNLGDGDMAKWGAEIRERFPDAQIAINPAGKLGGKENDGPLQDWQVDRMLDLAKRTGQPTTFVVRYDLLTDAAIARLSQAGTVSVWNAPSREGVTDVPKLTRELRLRGVDGVIDLRESYGWQDKAEAVLDKGKNLVRDGLDKIF